MSWMILDTGIPSCIMYTSYVHMYMIYVPYDFDHRSRVFHRFRGGHVESDLDNLNYYNIFIIYIT